MVSRCRNRPAVVVVIARKDEEKKKAKTALKPNIESRKVKQTARKPDPTWENNEKRRKGGKGGGRGLDEALLPGCKCSEIAEQAVAGERGTWGEAAKAGGGDERDGKKRESQMW